MPSAALRLAFASSICRTSDSQWLIDNARKQSTHQLYFILMPLNIRMAVLIDRGRKKVADVPYITLHGTLPKLAIQINREQYSRAVRMVENMSQKVRFKK